MKFERCRISEQYDTFRDKNVSEKGKLLRLEVKYKLQFTEQILPRTLL